MAQEDLKIPENREGWVMRYERPSFGEGTLHFHRELELNLVVSGRGTYLIDGGRYTIDRGSLLWLFPSQAHLLVEASDDFVMWVVVFRPRLVRRLSSKRTELLSCINPETRQSVRGGRLEHSRFSDLAKILEQLSTIEVGEDEWFNCGLGYSLKLSWEWVLEKQPMRAGSRVHVSVERALHLIREFPDGRSLDVLARDVGLSYSRLCRLFQDQTGETLAAYRNRMRVEKLIQLIQRYPNRTLLDVSLEAGFGSYAQCHRIVHQLTKLSPRKLRLQCLE